MTLAALRFRPLSVTAILQAMAAHTNRLAQETSPYLLQHQHNPVDWYPWGEAAFARARAEDRPILLSIGYSACHWCHVMERESFEDEQTAAIMNEHFVNVKVDREERPDVDSIYMTAVQRITGQGGWPMTVFITPEGEPFYGGTYFPPEPRHGMPSFRQLLLGISQAWRERRVEVHRSADELTSMLREAASLRSAPTTLEAHLLDRAATDLVGRHDADFGGFGAAPKFPQPLALGFLLRHWQRTGTQQSLDVVRHTLRCMARGGVYDHVGGGFHRYSVDAKWLVPHFEKMLYDNALLARVYLDAYMATKEEEFGQVATEVLDYVRREMTSPEGGFFSAQDADSEGEEGRFYVWTPDEIDRVLGEERGKAIRSAYGVSMGGNFERRSILNLLPGEGVDPRGDRNAEVAAARARMREARQALYATREGRVRPGLDDKVLTGWNAMMLRSFAEAGMRLGRTDYVEAARRNAGFLRAHLWQEGGLLRTRRAGISKIGAFLDDHALLVDALVSLYHATLEPEWIELATTLCDTMLERFWSPAEGVFYDASDDGEGLVVRPREMNDSATASGSSAACTALLRMSALTGMARYAEPAIMVLEAHAEMAARFPQAFGEHLSAMDLQVGGIDEVAVVGEEGAADTEALLEVVRSRFLPRTVFAFRPTGTDSTEAVRRIPLLAGREAMGGAATAYVCRAFACRRPVTSPSALARDLGLPEDG